MYEELVKDLRCLAKVYSICESENTEEYNLAVKAADAIEKLSKAVLQLADESGIYDEVPTLSEANLSLVDLSRANLSEANLSLADLSRDNLSEVNLSLADLSRAKNIPYMED